MQKSYDDAWQDLIGGTKLARACMGKLVMSLVQIQLAQDIHAGFVNLIENSKPALNAELKCTKH